MRKSAAAARPKSSLDLAASHVMQKRIVTISPTAPLSELERLLAEHRISGLPVTDSAGRAIGVVSYRDLLDHYADEPESRARRGPGFFRLSTAHMEDEDFESFEVPEESEDTVADVMTPEVISVKSDASIREAARTMAEHTVHRVLVTDPENGRVVGIVSSLDVLGAIAKGGD